MKCHTLLSNLASDHLSVSHLVFSHLPVIGYGHIFCLQPVHVCQCSLHSVQSEFPPNGEASVDIPPPPLPSSSSSPFSLLNQKVPIFTMCSGKPNPSKTNFRISLSLVFIFDCPLSCASTLSMLSLTTLTTEPIVLERYHILSWLVCARYQNPNPPHPFESIKVSRRLFGGSHRKPCPSRQTRFIIYEHRHTPHHLPPLFCFIHQCSSRPTLGFH